MIKVTICMSIHLSNFKISLLQVRLELTTSASLRRTLSYKYRALTDCATGAVWSVLCFCVYNVSSLSGIHIATAAWLISAPTVPANEVRLEPSHRSTSGTFVSGALVTLWLRLPRPAEPAWSQPPSPLTSGLTTSPSGQWVLGCLQSGWRP